MSLTIPQPLRWTSLNDDQKRKLLTRPALSTRDEVLGQAKSIIDQVRSDGDMALRLLSRRFDKTELEELEVPGDELAAAAKQLDTATGEAIAAAMRNIASFHSAQIRPDIRVETAPGVVCERISHSLDAVGLYVPGGSAPLPSTVMMLAIPARLAGCPLRIMCTPPGADGRADATVLATASLCGVQRVFRIGGAQAIAAMAYGTESVPRVAKIYGPGNQWVTAAKTIVAQDPEAAACDMPAGPSELMVIADQSANAEFVAADLLSQAEHGSDSQVLLLTDSPELAATVAIELPRQAAQLSRRVQIAGSLANSAIVVIDRLAEAIAIANSYAPEHLILNVSGPRSLLPQVRNAGSVFLGDQAPESIGDYCSGTNHVLPTYGWARSHSGLSVDDFRRNMTVQELSASGLQEIGLVAERLAIVEGLDAHANAVAIRLQRSSRGAVA